MEAMKISQMPPPNWPQIISAFPSLKARKNVIYCYGDTIFAPNTKWVPAELIVHESVHREQQGDTPQFWWDRYVADAEFRLDQEVEAYAAQYKFVRLNMGRKETRQMLDQTAGFLSSAMYGNIVSKAEAKALILERAYDGD